MLLCSGFSQITTTYNKNYSITRNVFTLSDHSIITQNSYYVNDSTINVLFLKFDANLQFVDSVRIDSVLEVNTSIQSPDDDLYFFGSKWRGLHTSSFLCVKINTSLDIVSENEIIESGIAKEPTSAYWKNDSILLLCNYYQNPNPWNYQVYYSIPTNFSQIDSVFCSHTMTTPTAWYNLNAINIYDTVFTTGPFLDFFNYQHPYFYRYSNHLHCEQLYVGQAISDFIETTTDFYMLPKRNNQIISDMENYYMPYVGETDDVNNFTVTGFIKLNSHLNPINNYTAVPQAQDTGICPFYANAIQITNDTLYFASQSRVTWPNLYPVSKNKILIQVLDTSLNTLQSVSLDPFPLETKPYYGMFIQVDNSGSILLFGEFVNPNLNDPQISFIIKYSGISELLALPTQNKITSNIQIYPNPTTGKIQLKTDLNTSIQSIEIIDYNGRCLLQTNKFEQELDLSHFANGFYLIKIQLEGGEIIYNKLIKN